MKSKKIVLDEYQKVALKETYTKAIKGGPGSGTLLRMATGTGKTEVGIGLLKVHDKKFPRRVHCWLTHREELREQSSSRLRNSGLPVVVMNDVKVSERKWYRSAVNVVSPQMRKWPKLPTRPGLLIVDEAHHVPAATWSTFVTAWQHMGGIVIGLTATPWRMNKRQGFTAWFQEIVHGPEIGWLQDNNYLAAPKVIAPQEALMDTSNAKIASTGDFDYTWMESETLMLLAHKPVIEHWVKHTANMSDKRTMWFTPTVKSAIELAGALGNDAKVITGDTPSKKRKAYLEMLREGFLTHLVSVDVLGEGLDIPSVPIIATLRPTRSLVVWLQQCGRASRSKGERGVEGGEYIVLDYANNASRHGVPDEEHTWSLEPREKYESTIKGGIYAVCYNLTCGDIVLHPANRFCWFCSEPQYFKCGECHVERRWTKFKGGSKKRNKPKSKGEIRVVCDVCEDTKRFIEQQDAAQQRATSNQRLQIKIKPFNRLVMNDNKMKRPKKTRIPARSKR